MSREGNKAKCDWIIKKAKQHLHVNDSASTGSPDTASVREEQEQSVATITTEDGAVISPQPHLQIHASA